MDSFFIFFLVGHCCFSHCRDVQMLSAGEGGGSGYSSAESEREAEIFENMEKHIEN